MLNLPRTTPQTYVSSILALNINSPEHTGDWHSSVYWDHPENGKLDLWILEKVRSLIQIGFYRFRVSV